MGKSKRLAALALTSAILAGSVWTAPPAHAVVARITIAGIYYNSPGPDIDGPGIPFDPAKGASVNGEYIRLKNNSTTLSRNLEGFTIKEKGGLWFTLPYYIIGPGQSVKVRSGVGDTKPGTIYWGGFEYLWNNDRDLAALRNASGTLADTCGYTNASVSFTLC